MKNKFSLPVVCALICLIIFMSAAAVSAENYAVGEVESLIDGIVAFKKSEANAETPQKWLDGELTANAGSTSEWYVLALKQYGGALDFSKYADALEAFLAENNIASASTRQRYALVLYACGRTDSAYIASTLEDSIGEQGIMSWVYGLHLLNNGLASDKYSADDVVQKLLSLRLSDGGWALSGEKSDVDVTAMTIQSLAPYYTADAAVHEAIDGALECLGEKQLDDGGFQSYGAENPESSAQVIVALTSLGIDPASDVRFIKNGCSPVDGMLAFKLADGSFAHISGGGYNHTATVQAFYSLVSLRQLYSQSGTLYIFAANNSPQMEATAETTPTADENIESDTTVQSSSEDETAPADIIESVNSGDEAERRSVVSYKVRVCMAVFACAAAACLILWLCKKRSFKNYMFVLLIAAVVVFITLITNFQRTDEYYNAGAISKTDATGTVTMTIRCDTVVGMSDSEYIPEDGIILPATEFEISENNGDSVFDILVEAARKYNIQMENKGSVTGAGGMVYIAGINYLYEFAFGDLSGWVYHVNGVSPSVGCGEYTLSDGDFIEWLYTCDLGEDVK